MEINAIFDGETVIPRKALLKNSGKVGSAASTIQKKEMSRYAPLNTRATSVLSAIGQRASGS